MFGGNTTKLGGCTRTLFVKVFMAGFVSVEVSQCSPRGEAIVVVALHALKLLITNRVANTFAGRFHNMFHNYACSAALELQCDAIVGLVNITRCDSNGECKSVRYVFKRGCCIHF